jgi:uncharacterized damage-inducible protein DinB
MSTGLSDFFEYNLWANLRLIDACSGLSNEQLDAPGFGTYGSGRETLLHLLRSEEGYARRFTYTGEKPAPPLNELTTFPGFNELRHRAKRSGEELKAIAEQADLYQVLHLDDGTYDAQLIIVLIQAINHGVDHRSQIATILSLLGIELPALDAWAYNDSLS